MIQLQTYYSVICELECHTLLELALHNHLHAYQYQQRETQFLKMPIPSLDSILPSFCQIQAYFLNSLLSVVGEICVNLIQLQSIFKSLLVSYQRDQLSQHPLELCEPHFYFGHTSVLKLFCLRYLELAHQVRLYQDLP